MEIQKLFIENKEAFVIAASFLGISLIFIIFRFLGRKPDENRVAQKLLDEYLNASLSGAEVGLEYERFIGFLHHQKGGKVEYFGAINGFYDMGRDLIVREDESVKVIQAKCWAGYKKITESHIFQLYGSTIHFYKTEIDGDDIEVIPVFYTSAKYSDTAVDVAKTLGVVLKTEKLDRSYPMVKCVFNSEGLGVYYLPMNPIYDEIEVNPSSGGEYVFSVFEAVEKGFVWSQSKNL